MGRIVTEYIGEKFDDSEFAKIFSIWCSINITTMEHQLNSINNWSSFHKQVVLYVYAYGMHNR